MKLFSDVRNPPSSPHQRKAGRKAGPVTVVTLLLVLSLCFLAGLSLAASKFKMIDEVGREVAFVFPPKRIVSLAPNVTEILFGLGLDAEIVGVSTPSDFPDEAKRKTKVGSYLSPDLERIVSLKPDLIIATVAGNTREIVERLDTLGLPAYVTSPKTFDGILESIGHLGQVVNRVNEAKTIVERMKRKRDRVVELTRGLYRPRVFLVVGDAPIVTAGKGSFADDLIRLAGGENVAEKEKEMYPRLGMEEVLKRAPDIIIISTMNPKADYDKVSQEWSRWTSIPAVKHHRLYVINSDLVDRPSPRIVDGLEEIARMLHPEVFKKSRKR